MKNTTAVLLITVFTLAACDNSTSSNIEPGTAGEASIPAMLNERVAEVTQGAMVFEENCQECHGVAAAGVVKNWQQLDANGNLPAPPLNGTAHAWHHDQKTLLRTINQGGIPLGGTMPPFQDKLSEQEKLAVLAYIKSLWPDELYAAWQELFGGK